MSEFSGESYSDYDRFAWIYNEHWGGFSEQMLPVLEALVLPGVPEGGRILDLCCGTGQLAHLLARRGYAVTGVDGSAEMIHFARQNAPKADLVVADARDFSLPGKCEAAVSIYDSLNHLLSLEELTAAFERVHASLEEGGLFGFDLNMESGFLSRWKGSFGIVRRAYVCVVRSSYDVEEATGRSDITMFFKDDEWRRSDLALTQRAYSEEDIRAALAAAGFGQIRSYDETSEVGLPGGPGRAFFLARAGHREAHP